MLGCVHFCCYSVTESANKTGNLVFIHNMTALIVKSVKKDRDIACFQCSVGNSVGEVSSDGCLNVICKLVLLDML